MVVANIVDNNRRSRGNNYIEDLKMPASKKIHGQVVLSVFGERAILAVGATYHGTKTNR